MKLLFKGQVINESKKVKINGIVVDFYWFSGKSIIEKKPERLGYQILDIRDKKFDGLSIVQKEKDGMTPYVRIVSIPKEKTKGGK